jgi:hypothetical protein
MMKAVSLIHYDQQSTLFAMFDTDFCSAEPCTSERQMIQCWNVKQPESNRKNRSMEVESLLLQNNVFLKPQEKKCVQNLFMITNQEKRKWAGWHGVLDEKLVEAYLMHCSRFCFLQKAILTIMKPWFLH